MSGTAIAAFVAPVFLIAVWVAVTHNRLAGLARKRDEAWSGVLAQLKRRHDLVPNLVAVVSAHAAHERKVLAEVTKMRAMTGAGDAREVGETERAFSRSLVRMLAVAESYPGLKADRGFLELQNSLIRAEEVIQMSRRYYNGTVRDYNTLVEAFPSLVVARALTFRGSPFFELEAPTEAETPTVCFNVRDE